MMIDASKTYKEHGDKKKLAPGQWIARKETKELINTFNFDWHKEDKSYFFDPSLINFYQAYLNPRHWETMITNEVKEVEVIKEIQVPFNEEVYTKQLLKHYIKNSPSDVTAALKGLIRRDLKLLLDVFEENTVSGLVDHLSVKFAKILLGNSISPPENFERFLMSYVDLHLGFVNNKNIYLTPGFRIRVSQGTDVKFY